MSDLKTNAVVDLHETNEFTEKHLNLVKSSEEHWKTFWPELYGDQLPEQIQFDGWFLVPNSSVDFQIQLYRAGSSSSPAQLTSLSNNIKDYGFKLRQPAVAWVQNLNKSWEVITGNRRGTVCTKSFSMKNSIVAGYSTAPGWEDKPEAVRDALEDLGGSFQPADPSAPLEKADIFKIASSSCQRFMDTKGEAGTDPTSFPLLKAKVDRICGKGRFKRTTRDMICQMIQNNWVHENIVVPWSVSTDNSLYNIKHFMRDNGLVDTKTDKYIYTSFSTDSQPFIEALEMAAEFKERGIDGTVHVIPHTGVLESMALRNCYHERIETFCTKFYGHLDAAETLGADVSSIVVDMAFPALGSIHDLGKPVIVDWEYKTLIQECQGYFHDYNSALNQFMVDIHTNDPEDRSETIDNDEYVSEMLEVT